MDYVAKAAVCCKCSIAPGALSITPESIEATQEAVKAYDAGMGAQMEVLENGTVAIKVVRARR
jgi:hypothetical protein